MNHISIPVEYSQLDTLLSSMEEILTQWHCSTVLRLRCIMVTEELFDAAYIAPALDKTLTCTVDEENGQFHMTLHEGQQPVAFPRNDVSALLDQKCTLGLCLRWENTYTAILSVDRTAVS